MNTHGACIASRSCILVELFALETFPDTELAGSLHHPAGSCPRATMAGWKRSRMAQPRADAASVQRTFPHSAGFPFSPPDFL